MTSGGDVTPPAAPTGLTPTAGDSQVSLAWSHASPGDVDEFVVEYRCPSGSGSYTEDARPTSTSEIVLGLTNGVECDFRVAAEDAANNLSAYAGPVQETPAAPGAWTEPYPPSSYVDSDEWQGTDQEIGYGMPSCLADYSTTKAAIEATPCGATSPVPSGSTFTACTQTGALLLNGDNITLDCVNWDVPSGGGATQWAWRCDDATGCDNLRITRNIVTGGGTEGTGQLLMRYTTSGAANAVRTGLIQDTIIEKTSTLIFCGSGVDNDVLTLPGSTFALVIDHTIARDIRIPPAAHSEYFFQAEGCEGVEIKNSRWDALADAPLGSSIIQVQNSSTTNKGSLSVHDNYFKSDGAGAQFSYSREGSDGSCDDFAQCSDNNVFSDNVISDSPGTESFFDVGSCNTSPIPDKNCPGFLSRANSFCDGNVWEGGGAFACDGDGIP